MTAANPRDPLHLIYVLVNDTEDVDEKVENWCCDRKLTKLLSNGEIRQLVRYAIEQNKSPEALNQLFTRCDELAQKVREYTAELDKQMATVRTNLREYAVHLKLIAKGDVGHARAVDDEEEEEDEEDETDEDV